MSNEFVMVPREWVESTVKAGAGEVMVLSDIATLAECLSQEHQGEPVAWLTKCKQSGLVEQAEPNEKASNPEHWTDAFPVYDSPKSARSQFDYDRGFAAGTAECETLRAQLAERDALLRDVQAAMREYEQGCDQFPPFHHNQLMERIDTALSASAEPSAPAAKCTNEDSWNCKYCRNTESCEALKDPRNFGEPSAPVEIDERAAFEKACSDGRVVEIGIKTGVVYESIKVNDIWIGWQARADLERKS